MLKLEALTLTERSYLDIQERNKKRDEELKKQQDPKYKEEEKKLQRTKKNWEIVRNVAQATVVSSGVDWSRDDELRQLVLACGDD
ncbi:centromere protein H (CENP-H)-domain-containing protein [Trichophaea hybrida]|nr:centromere protein H (CENP-H)-domain-containing protein [Trichophaea hybrida]